MSETDLSPAPLADLSVVEINGDDARSFLQGQLTNDVFALSPGQAQWQGYCQPQGRLLATFPLVCDAPGTYWAVIPSGIAAAVVKRLSMFVMRAKAKVVLNLEAGFAFSPTPENGYTRVGATPIWVSKVPLAQASPSGVGYFSAAAQAHVAIIDVGAQDLFVPQSVGWDTVGVNFKKGCYPGQEVVARAHYRGAVKRKPLTLTGAGEPPPPGAPLSVADDEVGHVVRPVELGQVEGARRWISLASIHQDALQVGIQTFDSLGVCEVALLAT